MKKKECLIFGATGKVSNLIINSFKLNNFFIHGVSRKSQQTSQIDDYKHYFFDITKGINTKLKKILNSKNLKFIVFAISKKEKNKNFEFDTNILLKYHFFFPIKIAEFLKKKNIKLIIINSDCIFSTKSKFPYSVSKLASAFFIKYATLLFPNLKFFSILMGKLNIKNLIKLESLLRELIKNHSKYNSRNFPVEKKMNQLKLY
jgi:hypothetical protein